MPAGDRTGPVGYGPMTGRAAGFCAGYGAPGYANPGFARGRGFGRGRGLGLGFRGGRGPGFGRGFGFGPRWGAPSPGYGYYPAPAAPGPQDELNVLRQESENLKAELDNINQRIAELESASE
ncbi:MAG: DUF5320 domain-containing protein [Desulfobacterales bacterium]